MKSGIYHLIELENVCCAFRSHVAVDYTCTFDDHGLLCLMLFPVEIIDYQVPAVRNILDVGVYSRIRLERFR